MNPRIKGLAEQAGITTNLDTDFFEKDPNKWVDYYSEKFAELIIKECIGICEEMAAKCAGLPGEGALAKDCAYWIKQHFGIEE